MSSILVFEASCINVGGMSSKRVGKVAMMHEKGSARITSSLSLVVGGVTGSNRTVGEITES